jgi:pimeloyl-ACP methyl ester carboxylesterase
MRHLLRAVPSLLLAGLASVATAPLRADDAPQVGYRARVEVAAPTRLDWVFPLANQSTTDPPAEWLAGYDSTKTTYELFVPAKPADGPRPLILFVSPGDVAGGFSAWKKTCEEQGIVFAGPHAAGNGCPTPRRVRIVLDVLDDVRRRIPIDPDRTYFAGFSGGGRIACSIAFALPELCGGVVPICAAGDLRDESWLRRRVVERLSVAHLTGETDFNRGEVERFRGPMLSQVGVRSRAGVVPNLGHAIPSGKPLDETFAWLEEDLPRRRALARTHPWSRIAGDAAPSRAEWAAGLLAEGKSRLARRETLYDGLMQLQGVRARWPDLPAAKEAETILAEHDARPQRPWEEDDVAEQRRFLIARARCLDAYASGPLPNTYEPQRSAMTKAALALWQQVVQDGRDPAATAEGRTRIPQLEQALRDATPK